CSDARARPRISRASSPHRADPRAALGCPWQAMLFPLIGARLHGWLDDLVVLIYLAGAVALELRRLALAIAIGGAVVHFALTRLTNYPQGTWKLIPFRAHAFVELAEGL